MTDESYSFSTARTRLEDIVAQVRKKDTSLEKSLDLLEEGVRLANACTELIDHQDWVSTTAAGAEARERAAEVAPSPETAEVQSAGVEAAESAETAHAETGEASTDTGVFDAEAADVMSAETPPGDAPAAVGRSVDFADADDAWADESALASATPSDDPSAIEG